MCVCVSVEGHVHVLDSTVCTNDSIRMLVRAMYQGCMSMCIRPFSMKAKFSCLWSY